jgi:hypothetical protein
MLGAGGTGLALQGAHRRPLTKEPTVGAARCHSESLSGLQLLQNGIDAIFRFVRLIWGWSVDQIVSLTRAPWEAWPLWKQVFLVLIAAAVVWALFTAAKEL